MKSKNKPDRSRNNILEQLLDYIETEKNNFIEDLSPRRVLIIDDDKIIQEMIGAVFEERRFKTYYSDSLLKACFHLKHHNPQIVILDLNLRNENGADLLMIREKYFSKSIVIVISGSEDRKIYDAIDVGADLYLKKPFDIDDLEKIIDKFFEENKIAS